jgi:hypothetical protein
VPRISATKRSSLARSSAASLIIANLFVDLQAIALAVGNNDAVGCRIELHRRREAEAPLRIEALYPAPGFGHVGVGVDSLRAPFRQYLGIIKHKLWELAQNDFRVREVREYNRQASVIDDRG